MSVLSAITKGLFAGLVGTAVMTVSETLEMKLTKRESSTVPAQVGSKPFGISLDGNAKITGLNHAVHWGHGTGMGVLRAPLSLAGLRGLSRHGGPRDDAVERLMRRSLPRWASPRRRGGGSARS